MARRAHLLHAGHGGDHVRRLDLIAGYRHLTGTPYTLAALVYFCINYPASKAIEAP